MINYNLDVVSPKSLKGKEGTIFLNDYNFSVIIPDPEHVTDVAKYFRSDKIIKRSMDIPTKERMQLLDEAGKYLRENTKFRKITSDVLSNITDKSVELTAFELKNAGHVLSKKYLDSFVHKEIGTRKHSGKEYLDGWVEDGRIYTRRVPLGVVFHNLASNSIMVPVASYIFGILTKNNNIMKVSGDEPYLTFQLHKLLSNIEGSKGEISKNIALFYWPGEQTSKEYKSLFDNIDGIVQWGGEESTKEIAYSAAKNNVRVVSHGPMISFEVIENLTGRNLDDISLGISIDSSIGDQRECHSSRLVFYKPNGINADELAESILKSMVKINKKYPRKNGGNTHAKIQYYMSEGSKAYESEGIGVTVLNRKPTARDLDMCTGRFVVIAPYKDRSDIKTFIEENRLKGHIQTLAFDGGYEGKDEDFRTEMSLLGFSNITEPGQMAYHAPGTAHDGLFNLKELTEVRTCQKDVYRGIRTLRDLNLDLPTTDSSIFTKLIRGILKILLN